MRGKTSLKRMALARLSDKFIDSSDISPSTDKMMKGARPPGRPAMAPGDKKKSVSIRLDADLLEELRKKKNWQTKVNNALRGMLGLF